MEGLQVAGIGIALAVQFGLLWYRIGKVEGRINGKVNGSYFKCPFYKGGHKEG
ncbi:hypothetical protein LCGC14_0392890 [marine sediment metagenome]|uniref:Uncharacterized protein n=1 Tax=marine sediment metagenome TaxID=412755 RepID=A0A0F9W804_9ZZZZ